MHQNLQRLLLQCSIYKPILVFYAHLKKIGQLKCSNDSFLINVSSAEELLKGVSDTESEETVDDLLACYDRTFFSRSLILNCIDKEFIAFQGDFQLDFNGKPDSDVPLM